MNKYSVIIATLILVPIISFAAPIATQANGSRVYVVSGNVYAKHGSNPAHRVVGSEAVESSTAISTGKDSSALIKFEDGETVTMQASSVLLVRNYQYNAAKISSSSIVLSMLKGGMRFISGLIGQKNKDAFRLRTPNATIGIRGTDFMVSMANNKMYSKVNQGAIDLTNKAGRKVLKAGKSALVPTPRSLAKLVSPSSVPSGLFNKLLSIPLDPAAIPDITTKPITAPSAKAAVPTPPAGAAAGVAAGAAGSAGGAMAGGATGVAGALLGSTSDSSKAKPVQQQTQSTQPIKPVTALAKPVDETEQDTNSKSGYGLTAKASTLGFGGDINVSLSDSFSTRLGFGYFKKIYNADAGSMNFKFNMKLKNASALMDWYPFQGSFRASGGLIYNGNEFSLTARPGSIGYVLNGTTYSSGISSEKVAITFNKAAPYFGIGWGNPVAKGKGWGFTSDFGLLFQGKPIVDLTITCATTCPGGSFASDAEAERKKLENDLKNFQWWPVASIGISYQW